MSEESSVKTLPEDMPLEAKAYDAGKVNNLSYEDELKCWYHYNYRGHQEREWSFKVFFLGSLLACLMVLINIYMGLKTGWGEGGSIIAVLLGFLILGSLMKVGIIRNYTMLETNMLQTIASAGGSLGNLVNVVPALLLMGYAMSWYDMFGLVFITSFMGVFFAIPLRRQNVVIEKLKFPSGTACYQTIKAVHEKTPESKHKAVALAVSGLATMIIVFSQQFLPVIHRLAKLGDEGLGKLIKAISLPEVTKLSSNNFLNKMYLKVAWSPLLFGIGFMTGIRVGGGMLIGGIIGFLLLPHTLLNLGYIESIDYSEVKDWLMWPSTSLMVAASFVALSFKIKVILRAFKGLGGDKNEFGEGTKDKTMAALEQLEVPKAIFLLGLGGSSIAALIFMHKVFNIAPAMGLFAIILSFVLALIAVRAAGETDINPVGAMGHVTQIAYGSIFHCTPKSNLGASGVTAAGASEAGDMMQDLKTGYLIGATPKKQVYIQLVGIFFGSIMAVLLLNGLFLYDKHGSLTIKPKAVYKESLIDKTKGKKHTLDESSFRNIEQLAVTIRNKKTPLSSYLYQNLKKDTQESLKDYNEANVMDKKTKEVFIKDLNVLINKKSLYSKKHFANRILPKELTDISVEKLSQHLAYHNHKLLQYAYPTLIEKPNMIVMKSSKHPAPAAQVWRALAIAMSGGASLLKRGDIANYVTFINKLKAKKSPITIYLMDNLSAYMRKLINEHDGVSPVTVAFQKVLIDEMNQIIRVRFVYTKENFAAIKLRSVTQNLLKDTSRKDNVLLNRLLLEDAFVEIKNKDLFKTSDFKDIKKLLERVQLAKTDLSKHLKSLLSPNTLALLAKFDVKKAPSTQLTYLFLTDLNHVLQKDSLYDAKIFAKVNLSKALLDEIKAKKSSLILLNRALLQEAYPNEIAKPHGGLPRGSFYGIMLGLIIGIILGLIEQTKLGKYLPSTIGLGISLIIPLYYSISIFLGSVLQVIMLKTKPESKDLVGPLAAGTIAGEPIVGTLASMVGNLG